MCLYVYMLYFCIQMFHPVSQIKISGACEVLRNITRVLQVCWFWPWVSAKLVLSLFRSLEFPSARVSCTSTHMSIHCRSGLMAFLKEASECCMYWCDTTTTWMHKCLGHSARFISTKWISSSTQLENEGTIQSFEAVSIRFIGSVQNLQSLCWTDSRLCEAESLALDYSNQIRFMIWIHFFLSIFHFARLLSLWNCFEIYLDQIWTIPNAACLVNSISFNMSRSLGLFLSCCEKRILHLFFFLGFFSVSLGGLTYFPTLSFLPSPSLELCWRGECGQRLSLIWLWRWCRRDDRDGQLG